MTKQSGEEQFNAYMQDLARSLDKALNGEDKGADRKIGFVLMVFPFSNSREGIGSCTYVSNASGQKDIVALFKEQIARFEGQPDVEGHA